MKNREELSAGDLIFTDSVVSFNNKIFNIESGVELQGFDGEIKFLESNMMLSLRDEDESEADLNSAEG